MINLSVIVPVHNASLYIEKCVLSIINQKIDSIEVLLIENNSIDNSIEICNELSLKYEEIKVIQTKEKGVSNARNIGLDAAQGQYIAFCDADDFFEAQALSSALNAFDEKTGIVIFGINFCDETYNILYSRGHKGVNNWNSEEFFCRTLIDNKVMGSCCNKVYKKEIIEGIRFTSELSMMEDAEFNCKVAKNNDSIRYKCIDNNGYYYVKHENNATNTIDNLFSNQKLKYIISIESVEKQFVLTNKEKDTCKAAKGKICADYLVLSWNMMKQKGFKLNYYKETKKLFWQYFPFYLLYYRVRFASKMKAIIISLLLR